MSDRHYLIYLIASGVMVWITAFVCFSVFSLGWSVGSFIAANFCVVGWNLLNTFANVVRS